MNNLQRKTHVLISLGLLLMMLTLLYSLLLKPVFDERTALKERYENIQLRFQKVEAARHRALKLQEELELLESTGPSSREFLSRETGALAAADLQNQVKKIIEANNARLISTQVIQATQEEFFPEIRVQVHFKGNINSMRNVLYSIYGGTPAMFIDNISVQQDRRRNRNQNETLDTKLDIRFELSAYRYEGRSTGPDR